MLKKSNIYFNSFTWLLKTQKKTCKVWKYSKATFLQIWRKLLQLLVLQHYNQSLKNQVLHSKVLQFHLYNTRREYNISSSAYLPLYSGMHLILKTVVCPKTFKDRAQSSLRGAPTRSCAFSQCATKERNKLPVNMNPLIAVVFKFLLRINAI